MYRCGLWNGAGGGSDGGGDNSEVRDNRGSDSGIYLKYFF